MGYSNISNNSISGIYAGAYEYKTTQNYLSGKKVEDANDCGYKKDQDTLIISDEAKKAYKEKIYDAKAQMLGIDNTNIRNLSGVSTMGYLNDFEKTLSAMGTNDTVSEEQTTENYSADKVAELKSHFPIEEDTHTDTFSRYLNKMAAAYNMMSNTIEEKYADPNREPEYYISDDGSMQELTKEKEQKMLEHAYKSHSEFMATSTEIWSTLKDTNFYTVYHKEQAAANDNEKVQEESNLVLNQKGAIKDTAYQAFMSAISGSNIAKMTGTEGSWNHVKMDFGVSNSQVNVLNQIWDYYANKE